MKQNNSKYHDLFIKLKNADDYFPKEDRQEMLNTIKDLHSEHQELVSQSDRFGKYGIRYKTVHEDSKFPNTHEQFFSSIEKRDAVFEDWINNRNWDNTFDEELEYPTPTPNIHDITKIFKEGKGIYEEKD